ncbi:tripartite tricarboxylate transporter substrate binding protein [Diaphorobacter sp. MNS-0]|uniref:Bug family tripartite tricarboxylate transporter substrate binding protein n=1 Tax=Diaphorobacter sp. MNS-0 TaxID=2866628 RepID=UPI001C72B3D1|nr:tripartite tricarboxylate transporter substrate-binding protein [Diaphorobacter sp. MNS-0]QYY24526.1 hypothetical protein K2L43_12490 [Diaphorobacter sp. MNS-0]
MKFSLNCSSYFKASANYRSSKDILPVSLIARAQRFIVAHPKTGVNTLQAFVSLLKKKPGEFTYGSSGIGSTHHLTMAALKSALSLDVRHMPFRSSGQSTPALVGGQVEFSVAALPSISGFVKSGQLKVLVSNAPTRFTQAPDIPAIAEVVKMPEVIKTFHTTVIDPVGEGPGRIRQGDRARADVQGRQGRRSENRLVAHAWPSVTGLSDVAGTALGV